MALAVASAFFARSHFTPGSRASGDSRSEQRIVARVGDDVITVEDFMAVWRKRAPEMADEVPQRVSAVMEDLVRHELLFAEASSTGFTDRDDIQAAWKAFVVRRFLDDRSASTPPSNDIDDAAMADYLKANAPKFTSPERRRFAIITFPASSSPTPEVRAEREQELARIREQSLAERAVTQDFGSLASRYSSHPGSRRNGGDVGWLTRAQAERAWPAAVVEAAFALSDPGDISHLVPTAEGGYLVKLMERQEGRLASLDSVRERIRREIVRTREEQADASMLREIRSHHRVETHPETLQALKLPLADAQRSMAQRPPSVSLP